MIYSPSACLFTCLSATLECPAKRRKKLADKVLMPAVVFVKLPAVTIWGDIFKLHPVKGLVHLAGPISLTNEDMAEMEKIATMLCERPWLPVATLRAG